MTEKEFNNLKPGDTIYYYTSFDNKINKINIASFSPNKNYIFSDGRGVILAKVQALYDFDISNKKCLLNYLRKSFNKDIRSKYSKFIKRNMEYFI